MALENKLKIEFNPPIERRKTAQESIGAFNKSHIGDILRVPESSVGSEPVAYYKIVDVINKNKAEVIRWL